MKNGWIGVDLDGMTPQQKQLAQIECAKLDGFKLCPCGKSSCVYKVDDDGDMVNSKMLDYFTYNSIIPLIQKRLGNDCMKWKDFFDVLFGSECMNFKTILEFSIHMFKKSPNQLAIALLKT